MDWIIRSDLPVPAGRGQSRLKYPFDRMKVGDSIEVTGAKFDTVRGAAYAYGKNNKKRFISATLPGEHYHIWRVE